jgi:hypothetical protein
MLPCLGEQELLAVDHIFHLSPLKFGNANLHESCVPRKNWTTFILVDFEVFR